jgi:uncharacterized protein YlxW (UPF0749 family)
MTHPVDPAYAEAARRRAAMVAGGQVTPGAPGRRRSGVVVTVVLALVAGWIATRAVGELRRPEPSQAASRAAIEREIDRRSAQVDVQTAVLVQLRAEITAAQQAQLTASGDVELAARAEELAVAAGEVPVSGPGLQMTLTDATAVDTGSGAGDPRTTVSDDGRVLDSDVQLAVNGLWEAGAEAVSINGRRLTVLSAIRSAGEAILVDFRPLVPPYVISAIGDPSTLQSRFTAGDAAGRLQDLRNNYGMGYDLAPVAKLDLPGAGTVELRTARPVTEAPASPSSLPSSTPSASAAVPSSPQPSTEVSP